MEKKEYKTINIRVYRTKDGTPTCRKTPIQCCVFLDGRKFGFANVCQYSGYEVFRNEESGSHLQPNDKCPIWSNESE